LDRWKLEGRELCGVLLTHHHHDHVGAVRATAERYSLPVLAHAETLERLELAPSSLKGLETREVQDGERIELGRAPDGSEGWGMTAHLTPGHSVGHLVFIEDRYRTAVVGDLISSLSTIVIDPPEGHMATYVATLGAFLELDFEVVIPAHGPAVRKGREAIEYHLRRRAEREAKLVAALADRGVVALPELLAVVYDDAPPEVRPYAERSLLAGLNKLMEEGRAAEVVGGWGLSGA
jgi:ribonuclease/clavin/mitogillin